jgi:ribosomal protein S18 acetylase RimI-like enzyme
VHLNRHESRHAVARVIFHGNRGQLRQPYREGQEDQLAALGFALNILVLWNTQYMTTRSATSATTAARSATSISRGSLRCSTSTSCCSGRSPSRCRTSSLAHPDAIELPAARIDERLVRVADHSGVPAGFHVLLCIVDGACESDGLFVEPELWRSGIGRLLVRDAVAIARRQRATFVDVTANPEAVAFYRRVGFSEGNRTATRFGPARRMHMPVVS